MARTPISMAAAESTDWKSQSGERGKSNAGLMYKRQETVDDEAQVCASWALS